ncbi:hypothetical protein McpSp1_09350 [Methanocorpusculaceae archaeon Sp1]|uniref:Tyr recombinase domain-containing protein n=2 Tax=Methanorbis furvi TaxID=3028299 RepID=A0AAE4MD81_9EURY|nr:hypothetical protein [Methanocorpusculaceae archaeon Sp1]MDV0441991.1 hypothetical protein [Methanocorpusculaceae archaeon Ag1]
MSEIDQIVEIEMEPPIIYADSATPVSDFLKLYDNKKTMDNYRLAIAAYLNCVYPDLLSKRAEDIDPYASAYLTDLKRGRNYHRDLKIAINHFSKCYAPMTANLNIKSTCVWLEDNGYSLSRRERQRLFNCLPPARPTTKELEIKRKVFREMYLELPEHIGTLLLTLVGSGMRLGEAMTLLKTDLDEDQQRTAVNIRAENTKTRTARTTYLTLEASEALRDYFTARRDEDPRVFPFSVGTAQYHFRKTADELGYGNRDPVTNVSQLHWHMTRKWFISRFGLAANKDIGEMLAGHEGYLAGSYQRYTRKQILKQFRKAEKEISILR